ncbi:MAG: amino acid ABC transporter substrate-binding protein [Lachnospiraceae bacterium]|mgnify:CR=1 FL=1|uniref:ABC transporter substrate-binding protein n=1 Tax=Candidatus Merdisoma sp. JLR.KK011 TaxID=3114299 RepID=UPI0014350FFD|nr:amino acid ABC transporter substrate-binding protein [Lachnospiraceae bacterium]GFI11915.1 arginine-binding extracellular protein ArtP [Lachnospiraceae bacterium]
MKKLIAVLLAGAMCASLAACGSKAEEPAEAPAETEAPAEAETPAEDDAQEPAEDAEASGSEASGEFTTVTEGVLTMGTNATFPPYEFYDGDVIVGIDAEIAQLLAEKLGLTLEIQDMDFTAIVTSVQAGKIDIGLAGMTVTEERLENVNFTDSYATGVQVIIVKEGSEIASVDDLEGKLIGVQEGTTGHSYCSDDYGEENVVAYANGATAVQNLVSGSVDCVVIDQQPAISFVEANEGLKILDTEYVIEDYAAAISKDNEGLMNALNAALKELIADGSIQEILDKYIKAE